MCRLKILPLLLVPLVLLAAVGWSTAGAADMLLPKRVVDPIVLLREAGAADDEPNVLEIPVIEESPVELIDKSDDDPSKELVLLPGPIFDEVDSPKVFKLL